MNVWTASIIVINEAPSSPICLMMPCAKQYDPVVTCPLPAHRTLRAPPVACKCQRESEVISSYPLGVPFDIVKYSSILNVVKLDNHANDGWDIPQLE